MESLSFGWVCVLAIVAFLGFMAGHEFGFRSATGQFVAWKPVAKKPVAEVTGGAPPWWVDQEVTSNPGESLGDFKMRVLGGPGVRMTTENEPERQS